MRTPAGKDCRYFYGNYYRGRNEEECRLIGAARPPLHWTRELCGNCPVPGILLANACPTLVLEAQVVRRFPFINRKVQVKARCSKTGRQGFDAHIGCGECHALPEVFEKGAK
jgi:hypothetical protein